MNLVCIVCWGGVKVGNDDASHKVKIARHLGLNSVSSVRTQQLRGLELQRGNLITPEKKLPFSIQILRVPTIEGFDQRFLPTFGDQNFPTCFLLSLKLSSDPNNNLSLAFQTISTSEI